MGVRGRDEATRGRLSWNAAARPAKVDVGVRRFLGERERERFRRGRCAAGVWVGGVSGLLGAVDAVAGPGVGGCLLVRGGGGGGGVRADAGGGVGPDRGVGAGLGGGGAGTARGGLRAGVPGGHGGGAGGGRPARRLDAARGGGGRGGAERQQPFRGGGGAEQAGRELDRAVVGLPDGNGARSPPPADGLRLAGPGVQRPRPAADAPDRLCLPGRAGGVEADGRRLGRVADAARDRGAGAAPAAAPPRTESTSASGPSSGTTPRPPASCGWRSAGRG